MTIGTATWNTLSNLFPNAFYPNPRNNNANVPKSIARCDGIGVYITDILQFIRSTSWRSQERYPGDKSYTRNCLEMCMKLFNPVLKILKETNVKTFVISFDPCGKARKEKAHTHKSRQKASTSTTYKPAQIELPPGQIHFFQDNSPLPGDMNLVFATKQAKYDLYDYLTSYLISERFKSQIPNNKRVIVSGGLLATKEISSASSSSSQPQYKYENIYAQEITNKHHQDLRWVDRDFIAEGDIDVWRMADFFQQDGNVIIESGDGDILLIGLMQMRHIFKQTPERRVFFKTRRSRGTEPYPKELIEYHANMYANYQRVLEQTQDPYKAYIASNGVTTEKPNTRKKILWTSRYVDVRKLWALMWQQANMLKDVHNVEIRFPVEEWVSVICIASSKHDYFNRHNVISGVGEASILQNYIMHMHNIDRIVSVFKRPENDMHHVYRVNVSGLETLSKMLYWYNALRRNDRNNKTNSKLTQEEYEKKITASAEKTRKTKMCTIKGVGCSEAIYHEKLYVAAAQLSWVLQYYGNGVHQDIGVVDGTQTTPEGLSIYGFTKEGFADRVSREHDGYKQCG